MRSIAIIPARGGSRGIHRKNLVPICGKPLIWWSAQIALAGPFAKSVVSTDDQEIANLCRSWGLDVIIRPAAISGHKSDVWKAVRHVLDAVNEPWDAVVLLQPTSPGRTVEDCTRAIAALEDRTVDSSATACRPKVHPFRCWLDGAGKTAWCGPPGTEWLPRQSLPPAWSRDGGVYATRPSFPLSMDRLMGPRIASIEIPRWRAVSIDEPDDLWEAENVVRRLWLDSGPENRQNRRGRRRKAKNADQRSK